MPSGCDMRTSAPDFQRIFRALCPSLYFCEDMDSLPLSMEKFSGTVLSSKDMIRADAAVQKMAAVMAVRSDFSVI